MPPPYQLTYDRRYFDDLEHLDPFDIPVIRDAVLVLEHQAEQVSRNRRPLKQPVSWCPDAKWQLRVRDYRVLYRIEGDGIVIVLRVKFKGSGTTEELGP